jgi:hypothetical protein
MVKLTPRADMDLILTTEVIDIAGTAAHSPALIQNRARVLKNSKLTNAGSDECVQIV